MAEWTPDELARIGQAEELYLSSQRGDGTLRDPVTMWVVRVGDAHYVRSMHGPSGSWFRSTQIRNQGRIRAAGVDKEVAFVVDTDPAVNDLIDVGYHGKYGRYGDKIVGGVVNPDARASTIKIVPR